MTRIRSSPARYLGQHFTYCGYVQVKRRCTCTFLRFGSNIFNGSLTARTIGFKLFAADCSHDPCTWTLTYGRKRSLSLQQAHPLSLPQSHSQEESDRWRPRPSYCHRFNQRDADECRMLNHPHGIRLARRLIEECRTRSHHSCHRRRRFTVCEERWLCKRIRKRRVGTLWA